VPGGVGSLESKRRSSPSIFPRLKRKRRGRRSRLFVCYSGNGAKTLRDRGKMIRENLLFEDWSLRGNCFLSILFRDKHSTFETLGHILRNSCVHC
jgi:hypothetical protein